MKERDDKMKTKQDFTLLEFLIVVAIIAILAGILMPALSSALRKAKIISCTGNQKSIGLALSMYAGDIKEFFPLPIIRQNSHGISGTEPC